MKKEYIKPTAKIHLYLSESLMDSLLTGSDMNEGELDSKGAGGGSSSSHIWDNFDNDTEE